MPTHGREGVSRYLVGSVTEKVVRLSSVPVLTAWMQPDEQLTFLYENILIPTDGSAGATHAVEHGLSLAASLDATVHVLSVVDGTSLGLDVRSTVSGRESEQAATDAVDNLVSEAETHGITDTVRHIEHGAPIEIILDTIESNGTHAVVTGTTERRGADRIMRFGEVPHGYRTPPVIIYKYISSG